MNMYIRRKGHKNNKQLKDKDMWPETSYTKKNRKPTLAEINDNRNNKEDCWCTNPDYCNQYCWGYRNGFKNWECAACGFLTKPEERS